MTVRLGVELNTRATDRRSGRWNRQREYKQTVLWMWKDEPRNSKNKNKIKTKQETSGCHPAYRTWAPFVWLLHSDACVTWYDSRDFIVFQSS